jgi:hypothetical protein
MSVIEQRRVLDMYNAGMSQSDIARSLDGWSQQGIGKVLGRNGCVFRRTKAWQYVNEHYFDVIDSEEKAYWLGFFAADGCVVEKGCIVQMALQAKDEVHVRKFAEVIGFKGEVRHRVDDRRDEFQILFRSRLMFNVLVSKGIVPNKSKILVPPIVDSVLERHMWRGFVDGDGCVHVGERYGKVRLSVDLVGTKTVCDGFKEFAEKNDVKMWNVYQCQPSLWRVGIDGDRARKLLRLLYGGCVVALERKLILAETNMLQS